MERLYIVEYLNLVEELLRKKGASKKEMVDELYNCLACLLDGNDYFGKFERRSIGIKDEFWKVKEERFLEALGNTTEGSL